MVRAGVDHQADPGQRDGDEDPAEGVEPGHEHLYRALRLGEALLQNFDPGRTERPDAWGMIQPLQGG